MRITSRELGETTEVDVLIIGAGIAGCVAALRASQLGLTVLVLTRSADTMASSSAWAQGGIVYEGPGDSRDLLVRDIVTAGAGLCHPDAVRQLAEEGPRRVREFLLDGANGPGVAFDRGGDGALHSTQEGAHSLPRIIHVGDLTGRAIQQHLLARLEADPRIQLLASASAVDLLTASHHGVEPADRYTPPACVGAYVLANDTGTVSAVLARETILATGGLGQLFLHTTNPRGARGDGVAMASRAGATITNIEFIQFHPTALYTEHGQRHLITEAVRGEGGRLIRRDGHEFMAKYDPRGSLAPRDIVARAIHEELLECGDPCVYIDVTHQPAAWLRERFPNVNDICLANGIDITKQPIPVVPAAHYACGGVLVDRDGRTTLERLWAIGEVSCTGVHGANRLASTSLLEGVVWGARAAEAIAARAAQEPARPVVRVAPWVMAAEPSDPALIAQDWMTIKYTMWNYVGLVRSAKRLRRARYLLRELELEIATFYEDSLLTDELIGLRNGIIAARLVTHAALANRRSTGCHFRAD